MIDIHCHILPGIDDGPADMEESLKMARIAEEDGIHTIVATPHCLNGIYTNQRSDILSAYADLNRVLKEQQILLKILPGSEVHLCLEIADELEKGRLMTINDAGCYISLEFPDQFIPETVIAFIHHLKGMNITPIVSHPERNLVIQNDIGVLSRIISAGALSQVTAQSLVGGFGRKALKCCQKIIKKDMIHFMASDAHSALGRSPVLSVARSKLSSIAGEEMAKRVFFTMPRMILGEKQ